MTGKEIIVSSQKLNKTGQVLAITRNRAGQSGNVPHLSLETIQGLVDSAYKEGKGHFKTRDRLLIMIMFDAALRCSETIRLRPSDFRQEKSGRWFVTIMGKGRKYREAAISTSVVTEMSHYAYQEQLKPGDFLFPINRIRVFQIMTRAFDAACIPRPSRDRERVGRVHIIRHSGLVARQHETHDTRATQQQGGHSSPEMALRYQKTVDNQESLAINQRVEFDYKSPPAESEDV